ncbi:MAG TPA: winged helix-turn-helix domain-containing protein, partial [Pyrinomonadaceae bacterium]|nr:winged helix-turn-helix domain-containing protein [Pyrinomonadaceae bacterium]
MATAYRFGKFLLNTHEQTLFLDDEPVRLRVKEFEILQLLVLNNGKVLSKDEMMSAIWKDTFVEESNLAQYISRLRKVLNVEGNQYITTHPKRGYRFLADLQTGSNTQIVERSIRVRLNEDVGSTEPRTLKDIGRLAVLPFQALGSRNDEEFLGLGIADALITQLTRSRQIVVSPTVSVKRFIDHDVHAVDIAEELNVDAVLQGNFQKSGDKIRLTCQLIEGSSGKALWAESFNSEFNDIFEVQDRIAERIARAFSEQLSIEVNSSETSNFTRNTDAYNEYLKGRVHFSKRTEEGLSNALTHFKRAIEIDPQFALSYTGIADVYQLMPLSDNLPPHSAFPKAKAAVLKALEIDDSIAEAHLSLAVCLMNYDWNFSGAELSFLRAIKLNPHLAQARMVYATLLMRTGRLSEAVVEFHEARNLDPLSPSINTWMAEALSDLGQHEAAIRIHSETLRFAPEYSLAHYYLSLAYLNAGRVDDALTAVESALRSSDDVSLMRSARVMVHAMSGDEDEARHELDALIDKRKRTYVSATNIASGYAALRDTERVFEWLDIAIDDRDSHLTWINVDFEFEYLRADPRFRDVLRKVNLIDETDRQQSIATVVVPGVDPEEAVAGGALRESFVSRWKAPAVAAVVVLGLLTGAFYFVRIAGSRTTSVEKNTMIRLTEWPGREINPTFTRDGRIRFGRVTEQKSVDNWIMNADGTDMQQVAPIAGMSLGSWSPDGTKVFFYRAGGEQKFYLANADGSDERLMPFFPGNAQWSPDSKQFLYQSKATDTTIANNADLFIYTIETGGIQPVVESPLFDADPIYAPDGKSILFVS